jgi:hypothetical protein
MLYTMQYTMQYTMLFIMLFIMLFSQPHTEYCTLAYCLLHTAYSTPLALLHSAYFTPLTLLHSTYSTHTTAFCILHSTHTTAASLNAGLDQEMPGGLHFSKLELEAALAGGTINEAAMNQSVLRILTAMYTVGIFDNGPPSKGKCMYSHTVLSLCSHYTLTVLSLYSHCTLTALSLHSHCTLTALSLHSHCTLTALSLYSHCTPTVLPVLIIVYRRIPFEQCDFSGAQSGTGSG